MAGSAGAAQDRLDSGQQHQDIVRLGDVVVVLQTQSPQLIGRTSRQTGVLFSTKRGGHLQRGDALLTVTNQPAFPLENKIIQISSARNRGFSGQGQ